MGRAGRRTSNKQNTMKTKREQKKIGRKKLIKASIKQQQKAGIYK